ncbi:DUF6090 family protein [Muriicola sp. Z0-33]|uniref:DUF6090 family protein n=1 Tax=Muriicola sp. Z0-33 TaxID=2816957 RepID=UPI002236F15D|nr:DUF6090 family protein [Muriicola sp. Z0-33]MCW5518183.1 hypothetical protein [Muriicola sp. Z0-33]
MEKNKTGKYIKYAIGEIVLVVIGILIALQINNWNESRKDQHELTNILQNIVTDMRVDALSLKDNLEYANEENKRIKMFLNNKDYSGFTRDSLQKSLQVYSYHSIWRTSGFDNLKNSGITEYGEYEKVVKRIKDYYDQWIPMIKSLEDDFEQSVIKSDDYWRFEEKSYELIYESGLHSDQSDEAAIVILTALAKSPIPRKILITNYQFNEELIGAYESYMLGIDGTVKEIEDALLEVN